MANIADAVMRSPIDSAPPTHEITHLRLWRRVALGAVMLLSIFMNFFQLGQNGYGNLYYAAGVKSMADNLHNFFFVSFDPGGFVTIDKPPLGFWLQTLSSKIFGFTPFSIFLPQAVCGVLAVLLLYYLVQRHFGFVAGLVAALALAVSPISVVTDRNNTIDGTLALVILLAAWAVIHAAETGKLRWLLLSGVFVGLGFNVKMAEAYLVVPALGLTYLLCAPRTIWTRIWHLLLVAVVMFAISISWALAVDLTPVAQRPYVGSTQDNSELSLAFGYNGLSRLHIGGNNGFGGRNRAGANRSNTTGWQYSVASNSLIDWQ
jgi:4-amino-4-deoxy-L-arabinose transferase-like glycosyltransferase